MTAGRSQFTLAQGRSISLVSLKQSAVYAGLLEGLPTRKINDAQVQHLVDEETKRARHAPYLIAPVQTPIPHRDRYPFGEPARLPSIACVGEFHSYKPARDSSLDCSDLTIIWFQEDYAFPVPSDVEHAIINVNWTALARDREY